MASATSFWPQIEPFVPWMHSLVRRLGVRERDVPDVVQRVLISLHHHWAEFDDRRALLPWLRVFVHGAASDYRKRSDIRHEDVALDGSPMSAVEDPAPLPDLALEAEQRRALLLEALDTLDFDRRSVLVLVEFEGVGVPEIAALLEMPVPTVHSRLRLAREDIARAVRRLALQRGHR
jgi:RNA polymerase sigma-70 factor (ECF subfamily)